jgi:diguanylate cyclase (GGDEF)-like protein
MRFGSLEELAASEEHSALVRHLYAAPDGLITERLSVREKELCAELEGLLPLERDDARIRLRVDEAIQTRIESLLGQSNGHHPSLEMGDLLIYLQELTEVIIRSRSLADLFQAAFDSLAGMVEFDLAVAVMLEQNLDAYVSRRASAGKVFNERLEQQIRDVLQQQLPTSLLSTDMVVRSDFADLPGESKSEEVLQHKMFTMLRQDYRPAGILLVFRAEGAFQPAEQRLFDFFANQLSMTLGGIRAHEQIENLADTDDLTGIWNKRYFRRQLPFEIERARIYQLPLSLIMFDIDNFKEINDTFGHDMGDVVLSELCGTVRESLRQPDLFARWGGDEFMIILPHTDYEGAQCVAERILSRVRDLSILADGMTAVRCSLSIGIATYLAPDMTAQDLTRRADERLYNAKKGGKNRIA